MAELEEEIHEYLGPSMEDIDIGIREFEIEAALAGSRLTPFDDPAAERVRRAGPGARRAGAALMRHSGSDLARQAGWLIL